MVLTKADKLKAAALSRQTGAIAATLGLPDAALATVSGKSGRGLRTVGQWMQSWTGLAITRPDRPALLG